MNPEGSADKQLDYNGLLLLHLSRLSAVCTSSFIDNVNPQLANQFIDPDNAGETALAWGTKFLYSVVPDDLRDDAFKKEYDELLAAWKDKEKLAPKYYFTMMRIMINLLHRKGLLIQNKVIGKKAKKQEPGEVEEVFE